MPQLIAPAPTAAVAQYLAHAVLDTPDATFEVTPLDQGGVVQRYQHCASGCSVVVKRFGRKTLLDGTPLPHATSLAAMHTEYTMLRAAREFGLDAPPYQVVQPLAINPALDALLVEAWIEGASLSDILKHSITDGAITLAACVDDVAGFLAALHERSRRAMHVDAGPALGYLDKLIAQLQQQQIIDPEQVLRLQHDSGRWQHSGILATARQSIVHGDMTPANLIWRGPHDLVVIDLERARLDDPAVDLGCVAAELKHWYGRTHHDFWASEPLIQALYHRYAQQRRCSTAEWVDLTRRGQFHMGCYLLRISRNTWLDVPYRRQLAQEAERCLRL